MSNNSGNSPMPSGEGVPYLPKTPHGDVESLTKKVHESLGINDHPRRHRGNTNESDDVFGPGAQGTVDLNRTTNDEAGIVRLPSAPRQLISTGSPVTGLRPRQVQAGHRNNPDAYRFDLSQANRHMLPRHTRDYPTRNPSRFPREEIDPQSQGPTTACVFIAKEDEDIRREVERIFRLFGEVFLKIRRDRSNLPFIFAQYTNDKDAARAFNNGQDINILGRPCRVEFANAAQVSYYITARDGHDMTESEAIQALVGAKVHSIEPLSHQIRQFLDIPGNSYLIKFHDYKAGREMVSWYNSDSTYAVLLFNDEGQSRPLHRFRIPHCPEKDSRTIWISNLHGDVQESEVHDLAIDFGDITNIYIQPVSFQRAHGPSERAWAFVEFERVQSVGSAIAGLHNTPNPVNDGLLVVEHKRAKLDRHTSTFVINSQDRAARRPRYHAEPETPVRPERYKFPGQNLATPVQLPTGNQARDRHQLVASSDASLASIPTASGSLVSGSFPGTTITMSSPGYGYSMSMSPVTPQHGVSVPYMYGYPPFYDPFQGWSSPGGFVWGGLPPPAVGHGSNGSIFRPSPEHDADN